MFTQSIIWLIFVLVVVLGIVAILVALRKRKQGQPIQTDYKTFFVMGIVWLAFGIPLSISSHNYSFFIMGLVFMAVGLVNKDKWGKPQPATKGSKKLMLVMTVILGLVVLITLGLVVYQRQLDGLRQNTTQEITNFQECIDAGYPVMESYPRQCHDPQTDQTFTEDITLNLE